MVWPCGEETGHFVKYTVYWKVNGLSPKYILNPKDEKYLRCFSFYVNIQMLCSSKLVKMCIFMWYKKLVQGSPQVLNFIK